MLTCFKICLKEAAEKQHTIIQACSGNMGYFLFSLHIFGFNGCFAVVTQ